MGGFKEIKQPIHPSPAAFICDLKNGVLKTLLLSFVI